MITDAAVRVATMFVQEILHQQFHARLHGNHVRAAAEVLGESEDLPFDPDRLIACLRWLKTEIPVQSIRAVLGSDRSGRPYLEGFCIPPPAPLVGTEAYDDWVRSWGAIAIAQGRWDGLYRGWSDDRHTPEHPGHGRLDREQLRRIIGDYRWEVSVRLHRQLRVQIDNAFDVIPVIPARKREHYASIADEFDD